MAASPSGRANRRRKFTPRTRISHCRCPVENQTWNRPPQLPSRQHRIVANLVNGMERRSSLSQRIPTSPIQTWCRIRSCAKQRDNLNKASSIIAKVDKRRQATAAATRKSEVSSDAASLCNTGSARITLTTSSSGSVTSSRSPTKERSESRASSRITNGDDSNGESSYA